MRPIHSELVPLHDERHGRAAALVYVSTEVLEKGFDLLPVEAAIQPPNLVERHVVAGRGTILWYYMSTVNMLRRTSLATIRGWPQARHDVRRRRTRGGGERNPGGSAGDAEEGAPVAFYVGLIQASLVPAPRTLSAPSGRPIQTNDQRVKGDGGGSKMEIHLRQSVRRY